MKIIDINTSRRLRRIIEFGQLAAAFTILCGMLQAYSSGPPPRYSGAPGDNLGSCSFCHRGLAVNGGPGGVTIVLPGGNSYTPVSHSALWFGFPIHNRVDGGFNSLRG